MTEQRIGIYLGDHDTIWRKVRIQAFRKRETDRISSAQCNKDIIGLTEREKNKLGLAWTTETEIRRETERLIDWLIDYVY